MKPNTQTPTTLVFHYLTKPYTIPNPNRGHENRCREREKERRRERKREGELGLKPDFHEAEAVGGGHQTEGSRTATSLTRSRNRCGPHDLNIFPLKRFLIYSV